MSENFDRQASIGLSYSDLLSKYGSIPKGEMSRQDVRIPSKLDDFTNISRYARTVMESTDNPEFTAQMKAALEEGLGSYTPYSNAKAIEEAQNRMRSILRKPPRLR